jgi:hypothetical protein
MEAICSSETFNGLHSVTSQKIVLFKINEVDMFIMALSYIDPGEGVVPESQDEVATQQGGEAPAKYYQRQ